MPTPRRPVASPLADTVTVGDTPGAPNGTLAPSAGRTTIIRADPRREYVAGGVGGSSAWYQNIARALPWAIDDLTSDFGDDLYERMLLDPQVASATTILKASVIEDGVVLAPTVEDADDPGYALATMIADAAEAMFDELETPLDDVLWNLLDAAPLGNRIAEEVYDYTSGPDGATLLNLVALRVKPRQSLAFLVDAYNRLLGFLARIPGQGSPLMQGYVDDPALVPNLLPRQKFALLTWRPVNGDPRGTSMLRAAYTPWNLKRQAWQEHLKYLAQFASPSLVGYTAPDAQALPPTDALGNPTGGALVTPEQALLDALTTFKNGSALALPYGSKLDALHVPGDGAAFLHAFDMYDRQITKAILGQTLASEEGKYQARAAALVHQDILDTLVRQAKLSVARMIHHDLLVPWVRYNWGADAVAYTPKVTLGVVEATDMPNLMRSIAQLQASGYLAPSQRPNIDLLLNLPQRTPDEVEQESARAAAPPIMPPAPPAVLPASGADEPQDTTPQEAA